VKKIVRQFYYWITLLFLKLVQILPCSFSVRLGGVLGGIAYRCVSKARRITESNLGSSFPAMSEQERRRVARQVFVNQGKNAFELFSFPKLSGEDIGRLAPIENIEGMRRALERGKGVLIGSAHCGNWELMGASLAAAGFPINVIARRIYIDGLNDLLVGLREQKGYHVILRSARDSARQMLRSLRHNEAIGMLIDQDTAVPGVFVDFFGRPAWTPSGLATLALRTGASVVLALDVRLPGDRHKVVIKGPYNLPSTGDEGKDVAAITQLITKDTETHIRTYPDQWVWMHERWKTRPETSH
jgi:KDO2-lipid IV(A) lauroyltransferase